MFPILKNPSVQISSLGLLLIVVATFAPKISLGAPLFKGEFHMKTQSGADKKLKVEIHEHDGKFSGFIAEGEHKTAQCSLDPLLSQSENGPLYAELVCKSTAIETMSTLVKIFPVDTGYLPFTLDSKEKPKALIRFGSWIQGYKELPLKVKMDKFFETKKTEIALQSMPTKGIHQ